jgi:hypothetical protein
VVAVCICWSFSDFETRNRWIGEPDESAAKEPKGWSGQICRAGRRFAIDSKAVGDDRRTQNQRIIDRQRNGNLSSALRIFVLTEVAAGLDLEAPVI